MNAVINTTGRLQAGATRQAVGRHSSSPDIPSLVDRAVSSGGGGGGEEQLPLFDYQIFNNYFFVAENKHKYVCKKSTPPPPHHSRILIRVRSALWHDTIPLKASMAGQGQVVIE